MQNVLLLRKDIVDIDTIKEKLSEICYELKLSIPGGQKLLFCSKETTDALNKIISICSNEYIDSAETLVTRIANLFSLPLETNAKRIPFTKLTEDFINKISDFLGSNIFDKDTWTKYLQTHPQYTYLPSGRGTPSKVPTTANQLNVCVCLFAKPDVSEKELVSFA